MTAFENSSFHETKVGLEFGIIKKNKLIIIIIKENSKDIQIQTKIQFIIKYNTQHRIKLGKSQTCTKLDNSLLKCPNSNQKPRLTCLEDEIDPFHHLISAYKYIPTYITYIPSLNQNLLLSQLSIHKNQSPFFFWVNNL